MGICWDTKKVNDFIEYFEHAVHNYMEPLAAAHAAYEKYENNETFVGQAAEKSKTFIGLKQKELNRQQYELSKEMLKKYMDLDETFKVMVDPAADARIDTDVVKKVQARFQGQLEGLERSGFNIQQKSMDVFDRLSKYGCGVEEVYFRNTIVKYDDYCGTGGFLHNCIKKMEDFDDESSRRVINSGLKNAIIEHIDEVSEKTAGLDSINPQATEIDKQTISLVALGASLGTSLGVNILPQNNTEEVEIKEFLDKNGIRANKWFSKKDGYYLIDKPLSEILRDAGVSTDTFNYEYYDDWYITGLPKEDGSIVYSIVKVREPMDDQAAKQLAVPFKSMKITDLEKIISDSKAGRPLDNKAIENLSKDLDELTHGDDYCDTYDADILNYYRNPESCGSYLIAEFAIYKIAHDPEFEDGVYEIPFKRKEFDRYGGKQTLDHLADVGVYDKKTNTIKINDPDNLTPDERTALLLIQTGDRDQYAYAAENQYHAEEYYNGRLKEHSITSDAGVGESTLGPIYEYKFKLPSGKYYKEQLEAHGSK